MDRPVRIQLQRVKGWRMPPNTVKVDRSTRWGNPYRAWQDEFERSWHVSCCSEHHDAEDKAAGLRMAAELFRAKALDTEAAARFGAYPHPTDIVKALRGKNLACWCKLKDEYGRPVPCHADVLLELANADPSRSALKESGG